MKENINTRGSDGWKGLSSVSRMLAYSSAAAVSCNCRWLQDKLVQSQVCTGVLYWIRWFSVVLFSVVTCLGTTGCSIQTLNY